MLADHGADNRLGPGDLTILWPGERCRLLFKILYLNNNSYLVLLF